MAATREANSKTEQSVTPEQQKKLLDKVEKCKQEVQKVRLPGVETHSNKDQYSIDVFS